MSSYAEITEKATNQLLEAVKPAEQLATSFAHKLDGLVKLPSLPGAGSLPTAAEVITTNFALAEKILTAQKDFALSLASSVTPPAAPAKATASSKS
jgi:hypothetical protein